MGGCEMVRKTIVKYFPARGGIGRKCITAWRPGKGKGRREKK